MKPAERRYTRVPEAAFCPKCHRRVVLPAFLKTANVTGQIRVECDCKHGVIVIAPLPKTGMTEAQANG